MERSFAGMHRIARFIAPSLACALALTFTSSADADEPADAAAEVADAPAPKKTVSYAWQTLLVDGAALGLMIGGASLDNREAVGAGVGIYAVGPPVVHFAHGNVTNGLVSAGARVLLPPAGAAAGFAIGFGVPYALSGGDDDGVIVGLVFGVAGLVLGGIGGYAGAVAVDAAVLAREPAREQAVRGMSLSPRIDVNRDRASIGVGGTF